VKFYSSKVAPNPRVVRVFMAERGIDIPIVEVDLRGGENRQAAFMAKNPAAQLPALELDDGTVLAEISAICEYLDETTPGLSLVGANALERAEARMWFRRIDLGIIEPLTAGFRYAEGQKIFEGRMRLIPQAADDLKKNAQDKLAWLDGQMDGKTWICGNRYTYADILLYCFIDFGNRVGQPLNPEFKNLTAWFARMKERPAAAV